MAFMDFLPQFGDNTDQSIDDPNLASINLKRKLALADSLRNTKMPQGQMIGDRYVAPSWTQYLAGAVDKGMAGYQEDKALKEYGDYQKTKSAQLGDVLKSLKPHEEDVPLDTVQTGGSPGMWETKMVQPDMEKTIELMNKYDPSFGAKIAEAKINKMFTPKEPIKGSAGDVFLDPNTFTPLYSVPNKPTAPTVRTMRMGTNEVTQQWNDKTQKWDQIATGPAFKPEGSATLGNRESVFINRIGIASNETAKDLKNIVKIPLTTSRGVFGGRQQGGSLFDAGKESLANAMTTQDVQSYNILASGLQRNLAAIEAAGLAPSGSLTHQMDAVIFKNGDTNYSKLQKLAQIKQIANAGIETTLSNPRLPEKQVKHFEDILNEINQAVPFDNADLITLQQSHQTNPNVTINDIVKAKQKNSSQSDVRNAADAILGGK